MPISAAVAESASTETAETRAAFSYVQLRNFLMDFADRYSQMIGQAADTLQRTSKDPDMRAGIHSIKLFPCSAAFSIAIDQNPHMALLDMEVLVHLQGAVWKENLPKRFGGSASVLLKIQEGLEKDIDEIALKVLTPEKLEELKALVNDWHKEHPDQRYVSYIRFSDFLEVRHNWQRQKSTPLSIGGLLSIFQLVNMDETTRSVDQARMVAERAMYLTERLPTILRWQTQMFFYEMASTPESKNLMATSQAIRNFPQEMLRVGLILSFTIFGLAVLYRATSRKK